MLTQWNMSSVTAGYCNPVITICIYLELINVAANVTRGDLIGLYKRLMERERSALSVGSVLQKSYAKILFIICV